MKSAIYYGKKNVVIEERPTPVCKDDDILLQVVYASICGTDVAVYNQGVGTGHKITVGGEFGHEAVCTVAAVGKNVTEVKTGDIVYPYPLLATGDPSRAGTMGAFSEYILVPNGKLNREIYAVRDGISLKAAALIEPFTVGTRAARRAQPKRGENAVVFGAGTIGIAAAIALKYFGCDKVMVVDRSDFRLSIAQSLGFFVCNSAKENPEEKGISLFGTAHGLNGLTADVPIYIMAAGSAELLETYRQMGKIESRMVVVGVVSGKVPVDILSMTYAQQALIGSGGYMPEDVGDVMTIMASGYWDIEKIITHDFPHARLAEAIETASDADSALNVIIRYR